MAWLQNTAAVVPLSHQEMEFIFLSFQSGQGFEYLDQYIPVITVLQNF